MDRDAVLRLAGSIAKAAEEGSGLSFDRYTSLRARIVNYLGADPDFEVLMPPKPPVSAGMSKVVINSSQILGMTATYLRDLASSGPRFARQIAATDLIEQARALLTDRDVHVAAPIVLAGAALEEALRDMTEARGLTVKGQPGLSKYAEALRTDDALAPGDVKEVTALADTRNDAAHGRFGKLSPDRAELFVDRVSLLLRQLDERGLADGP